MPKAATITFEGSVQNETIYCSEDDMFRICEIDSYLVDTVARISFTTPKCILDFNKLRISN